MGPNSSGAAGSTTSADSRRNRQPQQTLTIARMGSRIGKPVGQSPRKTGAVGFMEKAARTKVVAAPRQLLLLPLLSRTIAMLALPIGWRAGQLPRRPGAVQTGARDALQRLEDVPDLNVIWLSLPWLWPRCHLPGPSGRVHEQSALPGEWVKDRTLALGAIFRR